jgi:hypothetical protein
MNTKLMRCIEGETKEDVDIKRFKREGSTL